MVDDLRAMKNTQDSDIWHLESRRSRRETLDEENDLYPLAVCMEEQVVRVVVLARMVAAWGFVRLLLHYRHLLLCVFGRHVLGLHCHSCLISKLGLLAESAA